ncbi:molybdopterin biosynthesis enzyme [Bradyrhizobium diazoefficiens]
MALMPVSDALAAVLAGAEPLPEEMIPLDEAYHRVLARDVAARRTQPPEAMSAMDGYAVRAADAARVDAQLTMIGEVAAGRPFAGAVGAGEAVRIFTGGVVPAGADAVVIQEDTVAEGKRITIKEAAIAGRHIRPAGVDFREGDVLLRKGTRLTERDLALAAGMNHPDLPIRRRPKVAILATGDELVMPGTTPGPGQIVYSNGYALHALARQEGADTIDLGVAADTLEATTAGIRRARESGADILITIGGRLGRRPRSGPAGAEGRRHCDGVLEDRDAAGQADDARPARGDGCDRPARQSRVVLCVWLPVHGSVDSRPVGPRRDSPSSRARRARPRCRCQ